jgi:hypothetical protein
LGRFRILDDTIGNSSETKNVPILENSIRLIQLLMPLLLLFHVVELRAEAILCKNLFGDNSGASVEIELMTSPSILNFITTVNEKVGALFPIQEFPKDFLNWVQQYHPNTSPAEIYWESLDTNMKLHLLQNMFGDKSAPNSFFSERQVRNIKTKKTIQIKFTKRTKFLGHEYSPGTFDIDLSKFLADRVEYMDTNSIKDFSGVELHLQNSELDAGELLESAWILANALGDLKPNLHEHLVAKVPDTAFKGDTQSFKTAANIAEYFRRSNLLAEFITVLEHGSISTYTDPNNSSITIFNSIKPLFLSGIFKFFYLGPQMNFRTSFKMGWVGFRGTDFYQGENLYGFEYRALSPQYSKSPLHKKITSSIHNGMKNQSYGFADEHMTEWLKEKGVDADSESIKQSEVFEELWYKQEYSYLHKHIPPYLNDFLSEDTNKLVKIEDFSQGNHAVKMLLYNWAADPLFYKDNQAQEQLIREQKRALERFFNTTDSIEAILSDFIWQSGLLTKVAQTYNLTQDDFEILRPKKLFKFDFLKNIWN